MRQFIKSQFGQTFSLLLAIAGVVALTAVAIAAVPYSAALTVSNNTSTTYSMVGLSAPINNTWAAAQGFELASGLDQRVKTAGGTGLPTMVADNATWFAVPSAAMSSGNYGLTMGNTPRSAHDIVFGYGGYGTVAHAAAAQPSTNFTFQWTNTYLDTTAGATKDLLIKPGVCGVYVSPIVSGNVTAWVGVGKSGGGYPTITYQTSGGGTGTSFSTNITGTLGDLILLFVGTSDVAAAVNPSLSGTGWTSLDHTHFNGVVSTSDVFYHWSATGDTSTTISIDRNSYYTYQLFRMAGRAFGGLPVLGAAVSGGASNPDPPNLVTGFGAVDTMWFAVDVGTGNQASAPAGYSNYVQSWPGAATPYMGTAQKDAAAASENPGQFPSSVSAWVAYTVAFQGVTPVTITSVASGEKSAITMQENGAGFWLAIDGALSSNVTAVTVPTNTNSWRLDYNNTAPYMGSYKHYVGGNLILWYQPNTIVNGTVLVDRQGTQNGVITWGANPVTVTLGALINSNQPSFNPTTTPPYQVLPQSTPRTGGWFSGPDFSPTGKLYDNPLRPFIQIISDNTTINETQAWEMFGLFIVIVVAVWVGVKVGKHQLITGIVVTGIMAILIYETIWPWYGGLLGVAYIAAGIVMERSPTL